ncbi:MAG: hypothetical protein R3B69_02980 [Candidatus Paceibacterota bacterium]
MFAGKEYQGRVKRGSLFILPTLRMHYATIFCMNNSSLPFYRTRWFWGIFVGLCFFLSTLLYMTTFVRAPDTINSFALAYGSGLFSAVGLKLFGSFGKTIFSILYLVLVGFLIFKTFTAQRVNFIFPVLFFILYLSGLAVLFKVLFGLN